MHEILIQSGVGAWPSNKVSGDVDAAGPCTFGDGGSIASWASGASEELVIPVETCNDRLCQF